MTTRRVAIIEDDQDIAHVLTIHLRDLDCEIIHFTNGDSAYSFLKSTPVELIILDINLPGLNGLEMCKKLREDGNKSHIIMLTARGAEQDKVDGLEFGADDYMTKPFSVKEFIARVKSVFRRLHDDTTNKHTGDVIQFRQMLIDKEKRIVLLEGNRLELTPKEFDLLYLLASNPGVTFDRKKLLNQVWGYDFEGYEHTVNTHINRLRMKVEKDIQKPEYVLTTWGVGYRFNDQNT